MKNINRNIQFSKFGKFGGVEWVKSQSSINYQKSLDWMLSHVEKIQAGDAKEIVWLLEHEDIYTAGTSAKDKDFKGSKKIKILPTNRGGQWTWHGPGQRIIYFVLNLNNRKKDVRWFVSSLEQLIINTLDELSIKSERRKNYPGVWIKRQSKKNKTFDKIGAVGIRISRWIAYHGISININPDISKYEGIIPCGVTEGGVTSLADLGVKISMDDFDSIIASKFEQLFYNKI